MSIQTIESRSWSPTKIRKPFIKPVIKALDWAELIRGALPKLAKDSRKVLKHFCNGLGVLDLPTKGVKLLKSFTVACEGASIGERAVASIRALNHSTSIVGLSAGAVEVMHETGLVTLSASQLLMINMFGFICSFVLVIKSLADINKTFNIITYEKLWSRNFNSNFLLLVNKICRLALGLFAMGFFVFGAEFTAAPYLLLGLSSSSLILSIARKSYNYII
ncbi:MAG: hypothetical protein JSS30_02075 [Verrucomicrobia bacterium]|nr:hypothetical protein [Verrucomicrobiota bacterium]